MSVLLGSSIREEIDMSSTNSLVVHERPQRKPFEYISNIRNPKTDPYDATDLIGI